jgi:hypothetical protein
MAAIKNMIRAQAEVRFVALVLYRKPFNVNAVDGVLACRVLVAPRQVIPRARRQHADAHVPREVLREISRVQLGAAVDVGAISLHHNRNLHSSGSFCVSSPGGGAGGAAVSDDAAMSS